MSDLQKFSAKICYTASGMLIHDGKVLLIKHKKLGFWLNPGGHIEEGELPNKTAEREFWEETGIKVRAINIVESINSNISEYVPSPILTNLHWINKDSYDQRVSSNNPNKRIRTKVWPLGCEQHFNYMYLVEPVEGVDFKQNIEETDGIAWFSENDIDTLETIENIREEIKYGFKHTKSL